MFKPTFNRTGNGRKKGRMKIRRENVRGNKTERRGDERVGGWCGKDREREGKGSEAKARRVTAAKRVK